MQNQPPKLEFSPIDPLQDYYEDRDGSSYDVARLIDMAKDLPVFEVPLAAIDLNGCYAWMNCNLHQAAGHLRRVMKSDLSIPILLDWNGAIADGRHRIVKAIMQEEPTILARRMMCKPSPSAVAAKD